MDRSTSPARPIQVPASPRSPRPRPTVGTALEERKRRALLEKIAEFEVRGAILPTDARTLRHQLHDSASGQWKAVEVRLEQLALNWNPYQHSDATKPTEKPAGAIKDKKRKMDFYELLGLPKQGKGDSAGAGGNGVTAEDVKRQFRKLALLLHPDKKRAQRKRNEDQEKKAPVAELVDGSTLSTDALEAELRDEDSAEFARLRLAYETLSDPERRAAYDARLQQGLQPHGLQQPAPGTVVKDQIKLEASTDFASLEWMARVKHKMDVMARIAEWAKLLALDATELRFETGEPCVGRGCGKIVSMDRDLACCGSPRRRVYVCLLHKYLHACDERCTSGVGDAELDQRVCPMRAYWLIQNWLFDQLQASRGEDKKLHNALKTGTEEEKQKKKQEDDCAAVCPPQEELACSLVASEIHLGDQFTRFHVAKLAACRSAKCRGNFQFLEDGVFACRRHGTPHICTFEQCDRQELRAGSYVCWVSGKVYGREREQIGTDVRTRRVVYSDAQGDENAVEMDVPVLLPLGKTTEYLLEGARAPGAGDVSSLSPPPPDEKAWKKRQRVDSDGCAGSESGDSRSPTRGTPATRKRSKRERVQGRETSPVRKRLHRRLAAKVQQAETTGTFHIYLKVPAAVASLPKVALELQDAASSSSDEEGSPSTSPSRSKPSEAENTLLIRVNAQHTVNYIKYWMEELTEQQLSIWDQQIFWGDTLIGEETNVMVLEEHGISAGCVLELRLHDDCPLLVSTWNGPQAGAAVEYNTVQISKEAEEDLDDLQEELENVVAAEEQAFERSRRERQREKMAMRGLLCHTEVLQYDSAQAKPKLLGVIQKRALEGDQDDSSQRKKQRLTSSTEGSKEAGQRSEEQTAVVRKRGDGDVVVKEEQEAVSHEIQALRALASEAKPVKREPIPPGDAVVNQPTKQ